MVPTGIPLVIFLRIPIAKRFGIGSIPRCMPEWFVLYAAFRYDDTIRFG